MVMSFACFGDFVSFRFSAVSVVSAVSFRSRSFRFGGFVSLFRILVHAVQKPFEINLHPFERLGYTVPKNLHPFERLGQPFAKIVNPFERFGKPFAEFLNPRPFERFR